jgi:hypothetical protein
MSQKIVLKQAFLQNVLSWCSLGYGLKHFIAGDYARAWGLS